MTMKTEGWNERAENFNFISKHELRYLRKVIELLEKILPFVIVVY